MIYHEAKRGGYLLDITLTYHSDRYNQDITINEGDWSDGATGAFDIFSLAWWIHDKICKTGTWDSGKKLTNWQASRVISDRLWREKRYFRSIYWLAATFLFGGDKAKKNGMFRLK